MPQYLAMVQLKATCSVPIKAEDDEDLQRQIEAMSTEDLLKHSLSGLRSNVMWHTQTGE